ncbi:MULTISPECIES: ABC transporter permease [unclassified Clostridium]|uniref:ABC transporter permease n=1 Tax=unclassified Clostridium TaxID=2614128 RepID=UPI0025C27E5B|nr:MULTISPECIES: ABC transporter permease [unclassified Clostridium]
MYVFQNALKNIVRNRGRNILMGIIIFAIIVTTVVALIINNTASGIIDDYKTRFGSEVTITPNMEKMRQQAQTQMDGGKNTVRMQRPPISPDQYIAFGDSEYILNSTYTAAAGVKGENITPMDADAAEDKSTIEGKPTMMGREGANGFQPEMRLYGNLWEDFEAGDREIAEGRMVENKDECVISTDIAELNNISVGDIITLDGMLTDEEDNTHNITYTLTVVGTFYDTTEEYSNSMFKNPYMNRRNEILADFDTVLAPMDLGQRGIEITATYYLKDPDMIENFRNEVYEKGLNEIYDVATDEASYHKIVGPVEGLKSISVTFMIIVLILGGIILALLSSISIRERKYEVGVLRAMGMKKGKVALGLWAEMLIITCICLVIGISSGTVAAQPVANILLDNQIVAAELAESKASEGGPKMTIVGGKQAKTTNVEPLDNMDVSLGLNTIGEIIAISLLLASVSGIVSIGKITKYEPIKILMERN